MLKLSRSLYNDLSNVNWAGVDSDKKSTTVSTTLGGNK